MANKTLIIGFAGLIVALGMWTLYNRNSLPWHQSQQQQQQQKNGGRNQQGEQEEPEGDPAEWTEDEMKAWLQNRGETVDQHAETRVMLLSRIQDIKNRGQ